MSFCRFSGVSAPGLRPSNMMSIRLQVISASRRNAWEIRLPPLDELAHGADLMRVKADSGFIEDDEFRSCRARRQPDACGNLSKDAYERRLTSARPNCSITVSTRSRERRRFKPLSRAAET